MGAIQQIITKSVMNITRTFKINEHQNKTGNGNNTNEDFGRNRTKIVEHTCFFEVRKFISGMQ